MACAVVRLAVPAVAGGEERMLQKEKQASKRMQERNWLGSNEMTKRPLLEPNRAKVQMQRTERQNLQFQPLVETKNFKLFSKPKELDKSFAI